MKNNYLQKFEKIEKNPAMDFLKELFKAFPKAEVFLVGGIVRDIIINRPSKDYDMVVRKISINKLKIFLAKFGKVNLVGKNFGVLKFRPKKFNQDIDVALPRTEHSIFLTGGRRDFNVQSNPNLAIKKDLSRRDFTINAIAWDIKNQKIIDPFSGLTDIDKKTIRAVGEPEKRFKEDYSRMLRGLRFANQLNYKIEDKTWKSIVKLMSQINNERNKKDRVVPYEIISQELVKSFLANPEKSLELWDKSGAIKELIPELLAMKKCPQPKIFHSEGDVWNHTQLTLKNLKSKEFKKEFKTDFNLNPELVLAVLFHDIAKPTTIKTPEKDGTNRIRFDGHDALGAELAGQILCRIKITSVPNYEIKIERIEWLIKHHLFVLNGPVDLMRPATIAKYFFNEKFNGQDLLKLIFVDSLATVLPDGRSILIDGKYVKLKKRIADYRSWKEKNEILAEKNLIDGNEIIKMFNIDENKNGFLIGYLVYSLRQAQQNRKIKNKKEAKKFLTDLYDKIKNKPETVKKMA